MRRSSCCQRGTQTGIAVEPQPGNVRAACPTGPCRSSVSAPDRRITRVGPRLAHQAVTWLLERYGFPSALRKAGRRRLVELIRPQALAWPSG